MLVAKNIETLMVARGLDAAKLARLAGMNPTGIYDILSGKSRSPKVETISKIANALEVTMPAIFEDVSNETLDNEIMFIWAQLPEIERKRLLQTGRSWLPDQESA